ncbi:MAG: polyprenyl synthetase family protein [Planctomycetota bacterium]
MTPGDASNQTEAAYQAESSVEARLDGLRAQTEEALAAFIEEHRGRVRDDLLDAAAYALLGGGKRLRPVLCLLWAESCGGSAARAMPAAVAVECVHAFSLVHDDLPAIDDDDLRRGRPTLHVHTSEAMAILAGDFLLTLAYGAISRGMVEAGVAAACCREITDGAVAMIGGQVLDTFPAAAAGDAEVELAELRRVHAGKTGALFRAACRTGVRAAGGSEARLDDASRYADAIGLAFQAADDLLDVEADEAVAGKRTGKDAAAGKRTYPGLLGVDQTRREIARLVEEANAATEALGPAGEPLSVLARRLAFRRS